MQPLHLLHLVLSVCDHKRTQLRSTQAAAEAYAIGEQQLKRGCNWGAAFEVGAIREQQLKQAKQVKLLIAY